MADGANPTDVTQLSRARNPETRSVELRGECPREIVNVLDAITIARDLPNRNVLVNEILGEWAAQRRHELMILSRIDGGNPARPESTGGQSDA